MNTNTQLMNNLQEALQELHPLAKSGDENAHVKIAFGEAIYEYLAEGHCLTDLDWFKGTSYYTGGCADDLLKAA